MHRACEAVINSGATGESPLAGVDDWLPASVGSVAALGTMPSSLHADTNSYVLCTGLV